MVNSTRYIPVFIHGLGRFTLPTMASPHEGNDIMPAEWFLNEGYILSFHEHSLDFGPEHIKPHFR